MGVCAVSQMYRGAARLCALALCGALAGASLTGCAPSHAEQHAEEAFLGSVPVSDALVFEEVAHVLESASMESAPNAEELREKLALTEDYRSSFSHGSKPLSCQKYIMLHDTEGSGDASSVVSWWDSSGNGVAAHFIVNKDGTIVQCVPLDEIAHHAGFGDTGHNDLYGVTDESRDDMVGTVPIGDWAADYGMNSYSVGIEMVHVGGEGDYPAAQLEALDGLIAYIDAHCGFESQIVDHKAWRTGNSDTSPEFAPYLANYQAARSHAGL